MSNNPRPRVVIIGGGFGGLNAAKSLGSLPVDVTLIDKPNFHLFQLVLHLLYLVTYRSRVIVAIQWAFQYATFNRGARLITRPDHK